jgi:tetratricopeptide (TPR) repeat protein
MEQEINYESLFDEVLTIVNTPRGDFEKARNMLIEALEIENPIIEPNSLNTAFSFLNIVERTLFEKRFNKEGKYNVVEYPLTRIYYLIARTYIAERDNEEAIKYLKKSIKSDPFNILSYLELSDIYKFENEYDKMLKTLSELVKYAYSAMDMAQFYFELGEYYFIKKEYNIANILYSYSSYFKESSSIETALTKIAMLQKRSLILNPKKDCINYLNQMKIPTGAHPENVKYLYEMYEELKEYPSEYKLRETLKTTLYELTFEEMFEERMTIKNQLFRFSFMMPESWKILDKTQFNKASTGSYTLYVIEAEKNNIMNVDILKDVSSDLLSEYTQFRNFIIKKGFFIASEGEIKVKNLKYIQMISQSKLLNEFLTMIHCVFIINGKLIDVTCPTNGNYTDKNINEIYNDLNVVRINKLISSIEFL